MLVVMQRKLILASTSPRRKEILQRMGLTFTVVASQVDESQFANLIAKKQVQRLALLKAEEVAVKFPKAITIGGDSLVECKGQTLGKPNDRESAQQMWHFINGQMVYIYTGLALVSPVCRQKMVRLNPSKVWLASLSKKEIDAYIRTGEPMDKAGAFSINGFGARFIRKIEGDFWGAIGLSIYDLNQLLVKLESQDCDPVSVTDDATN